MTLREARAAGLTARDAAPHLMPGLRAVAARMSDRRKPRRGCTQRRRGAGRPAGRPAARACSSGRSDPDLSDLADADRARLRVLLAACDGSAVGVFNARHGGREHADNGVAL